MKQELVITGAALALVFGGAGVASAAPQAAPTDDCASIGRENIPAGDPQYRPALDRDRDGTACDDEDGGTAFPAATSDDTSLDDTGLDADRPTEGTADDHGKGGHEQVSVVPEGGAPTGDGSTEGRTGWWVGGGLLAALAGAGLAFRRRLAGLAGSVTGRLVDGVLTSRRVLRTLVVLAAALCLGAAAMGLLTAPGPTRSCPPAGLPTTLDRTPLPPSAPRTVIVDDVDACSTLVPVGVDARRQIEVPPVSTPEQAAWYRLGPTPGQRGPAVIVGHVDGDGRDGVFADLDDVERGDRVAVARADGRTAVFAVTGRIQVAKDAFPTESVYGRTEGAELRLITCGGALDRTRHEYADNVVVFAEYVGWR